MEYIAQAIRNLLPNKSWKMKSTPTNEQTFIEAFEIVTHFDGDQNAVYSANPSDFGVTWSQIETEVATLRGASLKDAEGNDMTSEQITLFLRTLA
jgi:hypothetical protein